MSNVGQKERKTQNRVVELFRERLGYEYGGNLEDQDNRTSTRRCFVRTCSPVGTTRTRSLARSSSS